VGGWWLGVCDGEDGCASRGCLSRAAVIVVRRRALAATGQAACGRVGKARICVGAVGEGSHGAGVSCGRQANCVVEAGPWLHRR